MQQKHEELVSSLMDGEAIDHNAFDSCVPDKHFQACWHRYHLVRDTIRGTLSSCSLSFNISENVANAIAKEPAYNELHGKKQSLDETKTSSVIWFRLKEASMKLTQIGIAACVTLAIITGVQYYQSQLDDSDVPMLNTVPVGVSLSPVGGIHQEDEKSVIDSKKDQAKNAEDKNQYDNDHLLTQDDEPESK